jgi:shikimate dehydrogenase
MKRYALLGKSLSHSYSKSFFTEKFLKEKIKNTKYLNLELDDISTIKICIKKFNISGFNVTIPYKSDILPFLDSISEESKLVGAVNTIKIIDGKLHGLNTDIIGFEKSIFPLLKNRKTALILGNGGASKAIQFVLSKLNINYKIVSRNTYFDYHNIDKEIIESSDIIINTTPLGTYPKTTEYPNIPYQFLNSKHLLFDLVYNPKVSTFLSYGIRNNCEIKNGSEMLYLQAEESWRIWNSDII